VKRIYEGIGDLLVNIFTTIVKLHSFVEHYNHKQSTTKRDINPCKKHQRK